MYYITKEIRYNKDLKKILKENIKFSPIKISKKNKYWENEIDYSLLGNAYELLFQIIQIKKEKRNTEFHSLKYSRGKEILLRSREEKISSVLLKQIYQEEKNIMMYLSGKKKTKIEKSILFLTHISNIRNDDNIKKIKIRKKEIKEMKYLINNFDKKIMKKIKNANFSYMVEAGLLIGEIDILIPKKIIDIKTTTNPTITREIINQQILYAILLKINTGIEIKEIGIYFQKYKKLKMVKMKKLIKNEEAIISYLEKKYKCWKIKKGCFQLLIYYIKKLLRGYWKKRKTLIK